MNSRHEPMGCVPALILAGVALSLFGVAPLVYVFMMKWGLWLFDRILPNL